MFADESGGQCNWVGVNYKKYNKREGQNRTGVS